MTSGSVDVCSVLQEAQFVGSLLRVDATWVYLWGSLPPWGAARERPEFDIKLPFDAPLMISLQGYVLMSFPQGDSCARQHRLEIRIFPFLGELPKAIEPHLSICQLYCWKLRPRKWSSLTISSLEPIMVTAIQVGFP